MYRRIHILGAAGSGKTTLAHWAAAKLAVPWYELDTVAYEGGYARKRTLAERLASLQTITAQPAWVTEGFYLWWIDDLLNQADAIVWLDLPWYIAMPRIITRHLKLSWAGANRHPGLIKLAKFTWWCRRYYTDRVRHTPETPDQDWGINRVGVVHYLQPFMYKVVHCQRSADVDRFREGLDE
jgi:adenylate kinase family enzyme